MLPKALSLFVAIVLIWPFGKALSAEQDREMAQCAAVENNVSRLNCFDELARKRGVDKPIVQSVTKGEWLVQTEISKIDDSTIVYLSVDSKDSFLGRYGKQQKANLVIVCQERRTHLYLKLGDYFLADSGGFGNITYRIDKRKAKSVEIQESTDHSALGLWRGNGIRLIREMFGASTFLAQVTPFNESPITLEMNIAGLETAISPLRKACQW